MLCKEFPNSTPDLLNLINHIPFVDPVPDCVSFNALQSTLMITDILMVVEKGNSRYHET